jgi:hypothetical protein
MFSPSSSNFFFTRNKNLIFFRHDKAVIYFLKILPIFIVENCRVRLFICCIFQINYFISINFGDRKKPTNCTTHLRERKKNAFFNLCMFPIGINLWVISIVIRKYEWNERNLKLTIISGNCWSVDISFLEVKKKPCFLLLQLIEINRNLSF